MACQNTVIMLASLPLCSFKQMFNVITTGSSLNQ